MTTLPSVFSAMGIWLVACLVSPCIAGSVTQEGGTGIDAQRKRPGLQPRQSALKFGDDSASTDIAWNTGNGSKRFRFRDGKQPAASSSRYRQRKVAALSRGFGQGNYVFELYGDAERRTLLATVTVSGVATELETSSHELNYRTANYAGCCLLRSLVSVIYRALLELDGTGARRNFPLEPASSPRPLHVARNLLLGLGMHSFV